MRILITGGAGFIGTNLIPKLIAEGHEVAVIDNMSHGTYVDEIHDECEYFFNVDCVNKDDIVKIVNEVKPDATFMFHGLVSIYDCHKDPQFAIMNNLIGSANVFDALLEAECPRVIFAETSAVYENCEMGIRGYTEDQCDPTTMYAVTKHALVMMARSYARTRGLKFTALRYFNVAGARQDFSRTVPPLFAGFAIRMIGGNNPIIFGDGYRRRDFIHVDDINDFHLLCLKDDRTIGETFNLGRNQGHSLFEIGNYIAEVLRRKGFAAPSPSNLKYTFFPEINGEAFEIRGNSNKARGLGWTPSRDIVTMLEDTIDYLAEQIELGNIDPTTYMAHLNADEVKIG